MLGSWALSPYLHRRWERQLQGAVLFNARAFPRVHSLGTLSWSEGFFNVKIKLTSLAKHQNRAEHLC